MKNLTQETVRAYHDARFRGDILTAAAQLADSFTFQSPMVRSGSATGHLAGLPTLLQVVTGVEMISELYGDSEASLVYNLHTATPVGTQVTAEHFQLHNGLITSILLIFDATAWRPLTSRMGIGG